MSTKQWMIVLTGSYYWALHQKRCYITFNFTSSTNKVLQSKPLSVSLSLCFYVSSSVQHVNCTYIHPSRWTHVETCLQQFSAASPNVHACVCVAVFVCTALVRVTVLYHIISSLSCWCFPSTCLLSSILPLHLLPSSPPLTLLTVFKCKKKKSLRQFYSCLFILTPVSSVVLQKKKIYMQKNVYRRSNTCCPPQRMCSNLFQSTTHLPWAPTGNLHKTINPTRTDDCWQICWCKTVGMKMMLFFFILLAIYLNKPHQFTQWTNYRATIWLTETYSKMCTSPVWSFSELLTS